MNQKQKKCSFKVGQFQIFEKHGCPPFETNANVRNTFTWDVSQASLTHVTYFVGSLLFFVLILERNLDEEIKNGYFPKNWHFHGFNLFGLLVILNRVDLCEKVIRLYDDPIHALYYTHQQNLPKPKRMKTGK